MKCTNLNGYGQECGDEGVDCDSCADERAKEFSYLKGLPRYAVFDDEQARDELNNELKDAGRYICVD
jgi:hypothetical protein